MKWKLNKLIINKKVIKKEKMWNKFHRNKANLKKKFKKILNKKKKKV
jgi:hypothetical protein